MSAPRELPDALGLGSGTAWTLLAVAVLLVAATVSRGITLRRRPDRAARENWRSTKTWWLLFAVLVGTLILGRPAVAVVMALVSLLALREGLRLGDGRRAYPLLAGLVVAVYLWAWIDWRILFTRVMPPLLVVLAVGGLVGRMVRLRPRLAGARATTLAVLLAVVGPSFVVGIASLPAPEALPGTPMGWLVFLLVLTELNDIAQALSGRALGSHALAPRISPTKTWEGFWGGLAVTVLAAVLLGPLLTSYGHAAPSGTAPPWLWSATAGLLVGLAGVAGDLTASALKRRAGAKDSGTLLPGHGGVLDRFDSLALAAPSFFFLTYLLWIRQP